MKSSHGQSLSTIDKERQIAAPLLVNMKIVAKRCPHDIYQHADLNAGSGWNDEYGVPGTPLVFVQLAETYLRRWQAIFFEIDYGRATELENRLRGIPHCKVEAVDNRNFLSWGRSLRRNQVGSVLVDPNGYLYRTMDGIGCPIAQMAEFFDEFPRMDLFANLNLRVYKQMRGAEAADLDNRRPPRYDRLYRLQEFLRVFHKKHGLISNLSHNGHSTFVRIVLRNLYTNDWRGWGWNHWDSPAALKTFGWAETTQADRDENDGQLGFSFGEEMA
jgi:hypothetical protein